MTTTHLLIDNLVFAKKKEQMEGFLSLADCPRLRESYPSSPDAVSNVGQGIHYVLQGRVDELGRSLLHLSIEVDLLTLCQRCLQAMPVHLSLAFNYRVHDVVDADAEQDDIDIIEPDLHMDLVALIEDEVLMAMPIAVTHEQPCGVSSMQSGEKPNPFAVLKDLLKS